MYDKKKRRQLWKKDDSQQGSVEDTENSIDIFLCDYCDATFVSEEAYTVCSILHNFPFLIYSKKKLGPREKMQQCHRASSRKYCDK